jgi:hypothetical protein
MNVDNSFEEFCKNRGYAVFGTNEFALKIDDAIAAIALAKESNIQILGGDVYYLKSGDIESAYANWSSERRQSEDETTYTQRTWKEAEEYIVKFPKNSNSETLFVLVGSVNGH